MRKLLKKHDKVLSSRPIKAFYTARMHDMRWVRNDYSDVVVRISRLYASRPRLVSRLAYLAYLASSRRRSLVSRARSPSLSWDREADDDDLSHDSDVMV